MTDPFSGYDLGPLRLANRIVMAPMTRCRATDDGLATPLMAEYYAQRAGAGLIVTEGIQPTALGQGYPWTPGLHTDAQRESWRQVTDAVHAAGGTIAAQLMHAGRISHRSLLPGGAVPVAPSAVRAEGKVFTAGGMEPLATPRALDAAGIADAVAGFAEAAAAAIDTGFDAVELHGANGYLIHQFLAPGSNRRSDAWGGSVAGRIRFAVEVAEAVAEEIGPERLGMRISPGGGASSGIREDVATLADTYVPLTRALARAGLGYLHVVESGGRELTRALRAEWPGALVLNPAAGASAQAAAAGLAAVEDGDADLVSFAALYLANPDLPHRLRSGGPYNAPDRATYYGGGADGYTDYAPLSA